MYTANLFFCPACYFPTADPFPKRTRDGRDIIDVEFEDISPYETIDEPSPIPEFYAGDRVIVSATATGTGEDIPGFITHIEECLGHPIISVRFDRATQGRMGITVANPGVLTKIK